MPNFLDKKYLFFSHCFRDLLTNNIHCKCSGLKQWSFYYARKCRVSGIWAERSRDGLSLLHGVQSLSWEGSSSWGANILEAPSLHVWWLGHHDLKARLHMTTNVWSYPHVASPCDLGFSLHAQGSEWHKNDHSKRTREKPHGLLWVTLGVHIVSLPLVQIIIS